MYGSIPRNGDAMQHLTFRSRGRRSAGPLRGPVGNRFLRQYMSLLAGGSWFFLET